MKCPSSMLDFVPERGGELLQRAQNAEAYPKGIGTNKWRRKRARGSHQLPVVPAKASLDALCGELVVDPREPVRVEQLRDTLQKVKASRRPCRFRRHRSPHPSPTAARRARSSCRRPGSDPLKTDREISAPGTRRRHPRNGTPAGSACCDEPGHPPEASARDRSPTRSNRAQSPRQPSGSLPVPRSAASAGNRRRRRPRNTHRTSCSTFHAEGAMGAFNGVSTKVRSVLSPRFSRICICRM